MTTPTGPPQSRRHARNERWFERWYGYPPTNELSPFEKARLSSIQFHGHATAANALSLAIGILLVFFGAVWTEYLVDLGIFLVAAGIVAFLDLERRAARYDREAVKTMPAVNLHFKDLKLEPPRAKWLRFERDQMRVVYEDEEWSKDPPLAPVVDAELPARLPER